MTFTAFLSESSLPLNSSDDPEQLPDESEFDDDETDREPDEEPDGQPDPGLAEQRTRIATHA